MYVCYQNDRFRVCLPHHDQCKKFWKIANYHSIAVGISSQHTVFCSPILVQHIVKKLFMVTFGTKTNLDGNLLLQRAPWQSCKNLYNSIKYSLLTIFFLFDFGSKYWRKEKLIICIDSTITINLHK